MNFAILIPARNEEDAIGSTLAELSAFRPAAVIVADNGSSDQTAARAAQAGATVVAEPLPGYGRACLAAMAALDPLIDVVVFMDADGSDDPSFLPRLIDPIARGEADLVIGSRLAPMGRPNGLPFHQRW